MSRGPPSFAQNLLDLLQELLDCEKRGTIKPLLFEALFRISDACGLHPTCFPLSRLQTIGNPIAAGGFGDIWKGLVRGQTVAVKIMRVFWDQDIPISLKKFGREALIWRQLCHPNFPPFFGLYYLDQRLCLVSPWMERGNVLQFLRGEPPDTDRLSLILDVALGIEYLHHQKVVHGDLNALNILVTPTRRACITDFGLSSVVSDKISDSTPRGGTARWQAPELLRGDRKIHFGSDVYAFACVCYEIMMGKAPFHELRSDAALFMGVLKGQRPSRPTTWSGTAALDCLWQLLQDCWQEDPSTRPTATQIVQRLTGPLIQAKTADSTDWNDTFSSKFRRSLQIQPLLPSIDQLERILFGDGSFYFKMSKYHRSLTSSIVQQWRKVTTSLLAKKRQLLISRTACKNCAPDS
ncbi:kinase-like domain-containing protein [Mycena rebaudengoi]|nr:kinase-like domain-containing protein [Mycena rebaudengoi]